LISVSLLLLVLCCSRVCKPYCAALPLPQAPT
jgi:hypothetical protein